MEFNLISRIADDKNFFVDLIYVIYQLKADFNIEAKLNFIGAVENEGIYFTLLRLVKLLEVTEQINFTRTSIRYETMAEDMKSGYFINLSVGNFIGYSSIECMNFNLKTIFYNVDEAYKRIMNPQYVCFCPDYQALINLLISIISDSESLNEILYSENKKLLSEHLLSHSEVKSLKSLII